MIAETNKVYKLGELLQITSGGTPSRTNSSYYEGDIPWIKTGDLKVRHLFNASEFITKEGLDNSSAKMRIIFSSSRNSKSVLVTSRDLGEKIWVEGF